MGVCHSPRWLPRQKTCQCPKWCNGLLGNQQLHRPELCALAWCLGPSNKTNTAHKAWGIVLLSAPQQSSCKQHQLPSSLLPEQGIHTRNVERRQTNKGNLKNLIMCQPKTSCRLDWPPFQLWWCPQAQTLQLLLSTSYNWNHNLTAMDSDRNGPALLLRFINCLNPPETVNSECKTAKIKHFDVLWVSILCLTFHLMRWHQMFWSVLSPYKWIIVRFPSEVFAASC